jgi:glycosyltransferase involved in cell wall biosynthesis
MNICFLTRSLPCHIDGGMEYHTLTLARELAKHTNQVTILTTGNHGKTCIAEYEDISIIHLEGTNPGQYSFGFFQKAKEYLDSHPEIEIVHSQGFAAMGFWKGIKQPLVTTVHGTLLSETSLHYKSSYESMWKYKKRLIIYPLYKKLLKNSKVLVVDSHFSRQLLIKEDPSLTSKIFPVHLGIDIDFYRPLDQQESREKLSLEEKFTILSLGRITETKGVQVILHALQDLADIPLQLIIGGTGPYEGELKKMVKEMGLSNVLFTGKISQMDKPFLYSSADVFVQPDLTAPAFGLVAAEAMACGTPVIASRSGALPEVVLSGSGLLFPRGDSSHLARLIRMMYEDTQLRRAMAGKARFDAVSLFDSKRMAENIIRIYQAAQG